jgi:hypothetical protein
VAVHHGNRWTSAEDDPLRQLIAEKKSITVILRKTEAIIRGHSDAYVQAANFG